MTAMESGKIRVAVPRSLWTKDLAIDDPKAFTLAIGKTLLNRENVIEIFEQIGLSDKPEELAGMLVTKSLIAAMKRLVEENPQPFHRDPNDFKSLLESLCVALEANEYFIDRQFFHQPQQFSFVGEAQSCFAEWLRGQGINEAEAQNISRSLPDCFARALQEEWLKGQEKYGKLNDFFENPFSQVNKQSQAWKNYRSRLQELALEKVFCEEFTLSDVYIPLRAYYEEKTDDRPPVASPKPNKVVVDLEKSLDDWLKKADPSDAIRFVTGGPGSGKSSFTKMFAARQATNIELKILHIPLHRFRLLNDIRNAIGEFSKRDGKLSENILDEISEESPLLIIFDGLDELSMQGKIAADIVRDFVSKVRDELVYFNEGKSRACLQMLIAGRNVVIETNYNNPKSHQLLTLLPYCVSEDDRKKYIDDRDLLSDDGRQLWWQKYGQEKGKDYSSGLPQEIDRDSLFDITVQPLLNYLVALAYDEGRLEFTEQTNLNEIYQDLLYGVYDRAYERRGEKQYLLKEALEQAGIGKEDFSDLIEEIALACWHDDGRTATVKEIEKFCQNSNSHLQKSLKDLQEALKGDSETSILCLLTTFYFRKSEFWRDTEDTFEFTHKSFSEYLTAKRIVREVETIYAKLSVTNSDFDDRDALQCWAKICGPSVMERNVFNFIVNEVKLQPIETVRKWQTMLCRLIESAVSEGMPMEKLELPTFKIMMDRSRNAEESLLAVLNACARSTREVSQVNWPSRDALGTWIGRLQGQRIDANNVLALDCLSFLNLQGCILDLKDLYSANLVRADLGGANLREANLGRADLERADLERADLERADLERANLGRAYLGGANLEGANLRGANLRGANLLGANLLGAELDRANLKGTILEGKDIAEITRIPDNDDDSEV